MFIETLQETLSIDRRAETIGFNIMRNNNIKVLLNNHKVIVTLIVVRIIDNMIARNESKWVYV